MPQYGFTRASLTKALAIAALCVTFLLIPIRGYSASLLWRGHNGDEVLAIQNMLLSAGFDPGPMDGIFGPKTEQAVMNFQRDAAIAIDGIVGPETRGAIERALGVSRGVGPLRGRTVVVDPGHGGLEPGAIALWGDKEKDFTLDIANKVRQYLEAQGALVLMTRYGDYTPGSDWSPPADDLLARVSIANSNAADLFLSIHINAYPKDPGVSGVMSFYREGSWESEHLAGVLADFLSDSTGLRLIDVQKGPYYVLNHTYMPAALVEVGFMTNWEDVNLLRQNWFQDAAAKGIARGAAQFLLR